MVRVGHHTHTKKILKWGKESKALKKVHTGEESYTRRAYETLLHVFFKPYEMKVIPVFQMRTPRLREMRVTCLYRATPFLSRSETGIQYLDSTAPMCLQLSVNI